MQQPKQKNISLQRSSINLGVANLIWTELSEDKKSWDLGYFEVPSTHSNFVQICELKIEARTNEWNTTRSETCIIKHIYTVYIIKGWECTLKSEKNSDEERDTNIFYFLSTNKNNTLNSDSKTEAING